MSTLMNLFNFMPVLPPLLSAPPLRDEGNVLLFLNQQPGVMWSLVVLATLTVLTLLLLLAITVLRKRDAGLFSRWFKKRGLKATVGPVSIETGPDTSKEPSPFPLEVSFDYSDYKDRLRDIEFDLIESLREAAREDTRRYVDDFFAQMKLLNQQIFSTYYPDLNVDHHFNTVCDGAVLLLLLRQLLNVFDRTRFAEMSMTEYLDAMESEFHRIKRLIYAAFAKDWEHPNYPFSAFLKIAEAHEDRGLAAHMLLMSQYKRISSLRLQAKEHTHRKAKEAREHLRTYGCLPDNSGV